METHSGSSGDVLGSIFLSGVYAAAAMMISAWWYPQMLPELAKSRTTDYPHLIPLLIAAVCCVVSLLAMRACIHKSCPSFMSRSIAFGWIVAGNIAFFRGSESVFGDWH